MTTPTPDDPTTADTATLGQALDAKIAQLRELVAGIVVEANEAVSDLQEDVNAVIDELQVRVAELSAAVDEAQADRA